MFYRRKISPALLAEIESEDPDRMRKALRFRDSADPGVAAVQERILAAIQDKRRQARAYHEESHMGERSAFFGGADPLWMMMAFGMATEMSPVDPMQTEWEKQRQMFGLRGRFIDHAHNDGGNDGYGGSSCSSSDGGGSSSSCSSSSCGSSCGGGGD